MKIAVIAQILDRIFTHAYKIQNSSTLAAPCASSAAFSRLRYTHRA